MSKVKTKDIEKEVADEFVRVLRRWLSPVQYAEMRRRNNREKNENICHSHDFCDANMAMNEAIKKVTGYTDDEVCNGILDEDGLGSVWNKAWNIVKKSKLS